MAKERRRIKRVNKVDGAIFEVCNATEWWSPRSVSRVVEDIDSDNYEY